MNNLKLGDYVILENINNLPTYIKLEIVRIDSLGVILENGQCFDSVASLVKYQDSIYDELMVIDRKINDLRKQAEEIQKH